MSLESQTLTILPWNELDPIYDLDFISSFNKWHLAELMSWKQNPGSILIFGMVIHLHTKNWPRYGQGVSPYQKLKFCVNSLKVLVQTDRKTAQQTERKKLRKHMWEAKMKFLCQLLVAEQTHTDTQAIRKHYLPTNSGGNKSAPLLYFWDIYSWFVWCHPWCVFQILCKAGIGFGYIHVQFSFLE